MAPYCDIIIPVWNLLKKTRRCLESIFRYTHIPFRLILVDNASQKPTADFLQQIKLKAHCPVEVIRNEENLGNIKAVNQGVHISKAPYLCILDNDTIVFLEWLERMIKAAESSEKIGIINPASNSLGFKKPWYLSWEKFANQIAGSQKSNVVEMATAMGFCMLVKRSVVDQIGGWSEDYGMGYYEDRDFSLRAARAGFSCAVARDAFVYHEEHASFKKMRRIQIRKASAQNRRLFEGRFGVPERIAFCLNHATTFGLETLKEKALTLARANHWVWIFHKQKQLTREFFEHSNIKWVRLPPRFDRLYEIFYILKKKKRFNRIYSDDPYLIDMLQRFRNFHRARIELMNHDAIDSQKN